MANNNEFSKGYLCAVAQIIEQHGETSLAYDVFMANYIHCKNAGNWRRRKRHKNTCAPC